MAHVWDVGTWKSKSSAGLFARRTNPLLREIDRLVEAYHRIPLLDDDSFVRRTAFLAAIFSRTGVYLDQHKDKEARRAAVTELQAQAAAALKELRPPIAPRKPIDKLRSAAQLHMKTNVGGGFRPTIPMHDRRYMLEAFGPTHHAALGLEQTFEKWLKKHEDAAAGGATPAPGSFWEWLEASGIGKQMKQITYLTKDEREGYRVQVQANALTWACGEGPLHSIGLPDDDSFIFVISPEKELFAGETVFEKFHHSSFLEGRPVLGAGQIQVNNGTLLKVTNDSGHYRPDLSRHYNTLLFLKKSGLVLSSFKSKALGHDPVEANGQEHFDQLLAKLSTPKATWKLDAKKKLELFQAMEPQARKRFLAGRGETEEAYVTGLLYGQSAATTGPDFLPIKA